MSKRRPHGRPANSGMQAIIFEIPADKKAQIKQRAHELDLTVRQYLTSLADRDIRKAKAA